MQKHRNLPQKTHPKSAPTSSGYGDLSNTPTSTSPITHWVHEPEAAKLLALKPSTLRNMRRERRLDAGTHWVYATGSTGGPVVYCIPAIREMQRQRTIEAVQKEDAARKAQLELRKQAVESYDDGRGLDQLITEVQS